MESLQKGIEPLQNSILRLAKLGSTANEQNLIEIDLCLVDARKTEAEMRARLFVLQVAKKYDLATAHKMTRRKAGEYNDPELAKVLEENDKRDEKLKRERERNKFQVPAKRARYATGNASFQHNSSGSYHAQTAALAFPYTGSRPSGYGGYNKRGGLPNKEPKGCHTCGQIGHFFKHCPNKK